MNECNLHDARSFAGSRVLARRAGAAIVAAFALISFAGPASAANADVTVTVEPLPGRAAVCPPDKPPLNCKHFYNQQHLPFFFALSITAFLGFLFPFFSASAASLR